jgi:hypothetical protein
MSVANPLWGAPRIHGELLKLGIGIAAIVLMTCDLQIGPFLVRVFPLDFLGLGGAESEVFRRAEGIYSEAGFRWGAGGRYLP